MGLLWISSGCSIKRNLPEGKTLLHETKIKQAPDNHRNSLNDLISPKPNRKVLGISRYNVGLYLKMSKGKDRWIKRSTKQLLGQAPVFFDSTKSMEAASKMQQYLVNNGYIHNEVEVKTKTHRGRTSVTYEIKSKDRYYLRKVSYFIYDADLDSIIRSELDGSHLRPGMAYSSDALSQERNRITASLRNKGYYHFKRDFILFKVDTTAAKREVDVGVDIRNPETYKRHQAYKIGDIIVNPDFSIYQEIAQDSLQVATYTFVQTSNQSFKIRPEVLAGFIEFEKGQVFSAQNVQNSINQISGMNAFKFIDIQFQEIPDSFTEEGYGLLNARIRLTPHAKYRFSYSTEINTSDETERFTGATNSRFYGVAPSISYSSQNIFQSATHWELQVRGGYEVPGEWFRGESPQSNYELGINSNLSFPSVKLPIPYDFSKWKIFSGLNLAYLFEQNRDFQRLTSSLSYQFRFSSRGHTHIFSPLDINLVNTSPSNEEFAALIDTTNNLFLSSIFTTHLLGGAKYVYIYNNEATTIKNHHWLIRWNVLEAMGNLLGISSTFLGRDFEPEDETEDPIFDQSFAGLGFYQYAKTELDLRRYQDFGNQRTLALRLVAGVGVPYGNTRNIIPFERRFFIGGINSIRAWAIRELGPGSFGYFSSDRQESNLNIQTGDFKLEGSVEYRFPLLSRIHMALFTDFGNIWILNEKAAATQEGSLFELDDFMNEIAVGSGFGVRLDFTYLIIRFDFAWRVHDPGLAPGSRWLVDNFSRATWLRDNARINLGVGYPF